MKIEGALSPYGSGEAIWHGPYQMELCRLLGALGVQLPVP